MGPQSVNRIDCNISKSDSRQNIGTSNRADSVEAMIGAHILTNDNLRATLQLISDTKLVPLEQAFILKKFDDLKLSTYPELKSIDL